MSQDIVNNNQGISYTNLDFSSIYTEVLDLIKNLTYKWDPSISDESDPGVILTKLSALLADKCNYNIDKNILEAFPLSVTQDSNAQQLYEQLGYYMNWYEAAEVPVVLSYISQPGEKITTVNSYTIPKFTIITNDNDEINYCLIGVEGADNVVVSDGILTTDSKELRMIAMEGTPARYTYLGEETVITSQMVDKFSHRIYFESKHVVPQNGVFITNTGQNNFADWRRVDNIYEQAYNELRYKFGYDSYANACYIEFPDNYPELFGDGIEITYLILDENQDGAIPAQALSKFLYGVTPVEDDTMFLDTTNVSIQNYRAAIGHREKEEINEAYDNYRKTVGTFHTLVTLRDYLNYIRSRELDICSNAFVCDRTNDIQSSYKIVSKNHELDSIIVKIEQIIDKTSIESNFEYKFEVTTDPEPVLNKTYYIVSNDELFEVDDTVGKHPNTEGWYEFISRAPSSHDAMTPFSLKFYLLNNSISLDSKNAFDETFEPYNGSVDIDTLIGNTAHLEHIYEPIIPLGSSSYKITNDTEFLLNKAYYVRAENNIDFILYDNYEVGDSTASLTTTLYELDVEALLPHTVFFKNIYPVVANVSTYDNLNSETQEIVQKNIINALYEGLNSSQIDFGEEIDVNYISTLIRNSDDRIKDAVINPISYYTKAIYYDEKDKEYKEVFLSDTAEELSFDQKDNEKIIANLIEKDIICKSILCGSTYLLTPDDIFSFHINQKFINYYEDISSITSQAIIDIGGEDAITTYSSDTSNPYIRQSYTLKPNETLSLYRPQLQTIKEFTSGIHYECFLYNDIKAGQSYELQKNEYVIFYQSYYQDNNTSGTPTGFSVYACTEGIILSPSMDIKAQTNYNAMTAFSKVKVIPAFETSTDNWYETTTFANNYITEIYNNSTIINNAISSTNSVKIQSIYTVEIDTADNYKFFWVLKSPEYSKYGSKSLRTYTLFPSYDVQTERLADKEKNSYTLKDGEWLYYVDSSLSNLAILGAGTTIVRNCGINEVYNDDNPQLSFSYVNIDEFSESGTNIRFKDGILETITSNDGEYDVINPKANGWYEERQTDPVSYVRTLDTAKQSGKDYFVLVMEDNSGLYKIIGDEPPYQHSSSSQTSDVFSEIDYNSFMSNINPKENGWYEIVTCMNSRVTDFYALSDTASYNNYLRYCETLDESILSRFIFNDANYSDVDISNINTYKSISITQGNAEDFDYISQRLVVPTNGDNSYKTYYADPEGETRVENIRVFDDPSSENNHLGYRWYEENENEEIVWTNDTRPKISAEINSLSYPTSLSSDYCFEEFPYNSWDSISFRENGLFFKLNSAESTYNWEELRTTTNELVTSGTLNYLISLYQSAAQHYPTDADGLIRYMIQNWNTAQAYNNPFKRSNKLGWRTPIFRPVESGEEATYAGLSRQVYSNILDSTVETYPRYSLDFNNNIDVVLPISSVAGLSSDNYTELVVSTDSNGNTQYIEVLDTLAYTNSTLVQYLQRLTETFSKRTVSNFRMELQIKLFRFKDLYRLSNKSYFKPNYYVSKIFEQIPPWTCVAEDNDKIADDPIGAIKDSWVSIQPNTSIRIVQNEMWSFSEGDTLRFEAPVATQNSVAWPRFSNTEVHLDLDSYSISYQRNGASIEELNKLALEKYDWQGYSHLLLNTSSRDGQKLESNHSLILYKEGEEGFEEVAILNGSDYENHTIQLKKPVSNVAGRYIDVTSTNMLNETILNSVYSFTPLISMNEHYRYFEDNRTEIYFDVDENKKIINSKVEIPLLLPQGKYLLPIHTETEGVRYWISEYIEGKAHGEKYCVNMSPRYSSNPDLTIRIGHNKDSNNETYGEHLYGYDKDKEIGLGNAAFYYNDTKYHYLDIEIQANPESDGFIKVSLPAYLSETYTNKTGSNASPEWFGWYELIDGEYVLSENTDIIEDLLEEVIIDLSDAKLVDRYNPVEEKWYEKDDDYYYLTTDNKFNPAKTYYKDKEFYVQIDDTEKPVLRIYADNPLLDMNIPQVTIVLGDIFKYNNNNELFDEGTFNEIKLKLRRLDDEGLYNYAFRHDSNNEIKDPLKPTSFFNNNHPYNKFIIPQMNFDEFDCIFTTRNSSRR